MGEIVDSILKRVTVTLADGREYDLHYPIASLIFLSREHSIDLLDKMSGSDETDAQARRNKFVRDNIDHLIMAGLLDKDDVPTVTKSMVTKLPMRSLPKLSNSVFQAIIRDVSPENDKTEVTSPANPPDAALTA